MEWPTGLAPGEVGRILVREAAHAELLELPFLRRERTDEGALLYFQAPWEAQGSLTLRVAANGKVKSRLVPLDPGRPLLQVGLSPPRTSLDQEVEVRAEALFPAEGAQVYLEGERLLTLEASGGGPPWTFVGRLSLTQAVAAKATPLGNLLSLPLEVRAWQGEREVRVKARLLLSP